MAYLYVVFDSNLQALNQIQIKTYGIHENSPLLKKWYYYLVHVIEQPNFRITNPQYLQRNFCFDFFNDSENKI